jgi:myo-inositol catabolism protein IolC
MDWNKLTPEEKVKWLSQQLEDIRRAQALIERFEQVTQKWLKRVHPEKSLGPSYQCRPRERG